MKDYDLLLQDTGETTTGRWATVTDDSPLRVKIDGDTAALGFAPDTLVSGLSVNDRVWVQVYKRRLVIIGKSGGGGGSGDPLDAYPIGAIYMSVVSTSPATLFGGTWSALQNSFLVGAGGTYAVNDTGGATTHTLATGNLPSHNHAVGTLANAAESSHTHGVGTYDAAAESSHTHGVGSFVTGNQSASHSHLLGFDTDGQLGSNERVLHSAGVSGAEGTLSSGTQSASHTHTISGTSAAGSSHDHALSGSSAAGASHNHTISGSTDSTGSGTAVNHLPPYLAVYMWKRTA